MIPKGTALPVRMTIKPGGFDDPANGWTGGWATESNDTGAVYLACEFVITSGPYFKRKIWTNVGLYSPKGPTWGQMGRSFIRAALNSARHIDPQDMRPPACAARCIQSLGELDGLAFLARADTEKDEQGHWRNVIKTAIEPDHKDYDAWRAQSTFPTIQVPPLSAGTPPHRPASPVTSSAASSASSSAAPSPAAAPGISRAISPGITPAMTPPPHSALNKPAWAR